MDVAHSVSWLDEFIKSLMGAGEVVPSDAVTPADSYTARLEFIEEKISSILAECLKKSGVEHSIPVVRAQGTDPVFAAVRSLKRALRCAASSAPASAAAPGEEQAPLRQQVRPRRRVGSAIRSVARRLVTRALRQCICSTQAELQRPPQLSCRTASKLAS